MDADLAAIAPARHWAGERFERAGLVPQARELLAILVSELVTNAVRHAAPPVVLRIDVDDERTRVEVEDHAPQLPVLTEPPPSALGGRGVKIVDMLSTAWGAVPHRGEPGKTVWFELAHPAPLGV
ncbi:ATP-binding protein [Cellulomonas fimi]|uniref:ATP-binding protein n=1 Tax=Cellulomonas fimi TaxID=1708 RepID=UPI0028937213|nr:ATP-binding protein [Cellulomonas fimi]